MHAVSISAAPQNLARVVVPSFRFRPDPTDFHGGQDAYVHGLVRELVRRGSYVEVIAFGGRDDPKTAHCEGARVRYVHTEMSSQATAHGLHQTTRWNLLQAMQEYGEAVARELAEMRRSRGQLTILSQDIAEAGWLPSSRRAGDRIATFAHLLFSEFALNDVTLEEFERTHAEVKFPTPIAFIARRVLSAKTSAKDLERANRWVAALGLDALIPARVRSAFEAERAAFSLAQRVLIPSAAMRAKIAERFPRRDAPVALQVAPWAVDVAPVEPPHVRALMQELRIQRGDLVLVTMSRLSPDKRLEAIIGALEQIEQRDPAVASRVNLLICGRPAFFDDERYARGLVERAQGLTRARVHFRGWVTGREKSAHLALAAGRGLFLQVGRCEAFGLGIVEALRFGVPAVASDTDGPREILHQSRAGILLSGSRPLEAQIADAVCDYLHHETRLSSEAARQVAARYTWDAAVSAIDRAMRRV